MWNSILNNDYFNQVEEKVENIYNVLMNDQPTDSDCDNSLLGGGSGIMIFIYYYGKFKNDKEIIDYSLKELHKISKGIKPVDSEYNLCFGISGILWGLYHIINSELAKYKSSQQQISELDLSILNESVMDLKSGNIDLFYGGTGSFVYFLEKYPIHILKPILQKFLEEIEIIAEYSGEEVRWSSDFISKISPGELTNQYFLSIPHGSLSLIWIMSIMFKNGISTDLCQKLIHYTVEWIRSSQNQDGFISLFPISDNDRSTNRYSRLAWCYGDLGVAISLLNASRCLNNESIRKYSIEIALHTCGRQHFDYTHVKDAGLCHGASGIAHIYNRFYQETYVDEFKIAANYWYGEVLSYSKFPDGLAGYKIWNQKDSLWENDYGLLEGIAGIGLSLIGAIDSNEPNWDRCLLLSSL